MCLSFLDHYCEDIYLESVGSVKMSSASHILWFSPHLLYSAVSAASELELDLILLFHLTKEMDCEKSISYHLNEKSDGPSRRTVIL